MTPPPSEEPKKTSGDRAIAWWHRHKHNFILSFLIGLFILIIFYENIVISIYPGQQGVLWARLDGTRDKVYGEGLHLIFPWDKLYVYDMRLQEINDKVHLLTKDGLLIDVDISARFRPVKKDLHRLHMEVGPDYIEKVVRPELVSALRSVLGNFNLHEIYGMDEAQLLGDIQTLAQQRIDPTFIFLHDLLMVQLILPVELQKEINLKHTKEQIALSYRHILNAARQEAERREIEANGLKRFEDVSGVPILKWRGIEATETLAASNNAKFVVIGSDQNSLPVILNVDKSNSGPSPSDATEPNPTDNDGTPPTPTQTPAPGTP